MICDEAFISCALDVPAVVSNVRINPSNAVCHVQDEAKGIWSKVIDLESCDRADLSALMANINFMRKLSVVLPKNDSVSLPVNIQLRDTSLILAYKRSPLGSAFDVRNNLHDLSEDIVAAIISRTLACIADLHAGGILHRELCAKHVLLIERASGDVGVKLCGLGSAAEYSPNPSFASRNDLPPVHLSWRGWNLPGTKNSNSIHPMAWYAPEVIAQDFTGYAQPADIYSLGFTLAELYTGVPPYVNLSPTEIVLKKLCNPDVPKLQKLDTNRSPSQPMLDVYNACTQHDPTKRPSAQSLLQMPWIKRGLERPLKCSDLTVQ